MSANRAPLPGLQAQLAFAGRKFHAWWEGYAFDGTAERATLRAQFQVKNASNRTPEDLVAEAIWGNGRLEPGTPAWTLRFARLLSLPVRANVIVFGAGEGAPLSDLKHATRWKLSGLTHAKNVAQGNLRSYDLAMQRVDKAGAAGAISFFELHRDASPASFASFAAELLLPGAKTCFVDYVVARKGARLRSCFPASKNGAPKTEGEYRDALKNAGFSIDDAIDETSAFMPLVAEGWSRWRRAYSGISNIENTPLRIDMMRALAAQAGLWAERYEALKSGQLRVVCFRTTRR